MIAYASRDSRVECRRRARLGNRRQRRLPGRALGPPRPQDPPPLQPGDVVTLTVEGIGSADQHGRRRGPRARRSRRYGAAIPRAATAGPADERPDRTDRGRHRGRLGDRRRGGRRGRAGRWRRWSASTARPRPTCGPSTCATPRAVGRAAPHELDRRHRRARTGQLRGHHLAGPARRRHPRALHRHPRRQRPRAAARHPGTRTADAARRARSSTSARSPPSRATTRSRTPPASGRCAD